MEGFIRLTLLAFIVFILIKILFLGFSAMLLFLLFINTLTYGFLKLTQKEEGAY